ncbi:MAG: glycoside hydrolase family 28 protein [Verrucomicrobiia bacterium]
MRITFLLIVALLCPLAQAETNTTFDVRAFGATGDGRTKDTAAFQKALDACAAAKGGTVAVTSGVYLVGSIVIGSNTTLQLDGRASLLGSPDIEDYPLVRVRWEGEYAEGHRALIAAEKADHIAIKGRGYIYGPPISVSRLRNPRGPALIELTECNDVTLDGFTTQYQQLWSIHPVLCRKLVASNLKIRSVSFNGDGIDLDSCQDVLIEHCNIDTGDDALVLKSGRGLAAVRLERPTQDVVIRDCTLVSSIFAGFAIGSELSGGIRNVRIENCFISGRQNGISLKSREGRGGYIENVTGEDLVINNTPTFLAIDLLKKGIQATDPVTGELEKWTRVRDIRFNKIQVNKVTDLVLAKNIPAARPVDGLSLTDIQGACKRAITLANMTNVVLNGINVTGYQGAFLTTTNVHGTGLEGSK